MSEPVEGLTPMELKHRMEEGESFALLDVRENFERSIAAIKVPPNVLDIHIPMQQLSDLLDELRPSIREGRTVIYCHHGVRSAAVVQWIQSQGIGNVENLNGGIDAWSIEVDPKTPRY